MFEGAGECRVSVEDVGAGCVCCGGAGDEGFGVAEVVCFVVEGDGAGGVGCVCCEGARGVGEGCGHFGGGRGGMVWMMILYVT